MLHFPDKQTKVSGDLGLPQVTQGLPRWLSGREPACQCRRHERPRFDSWVGKMPWRRAWQSTPVFLPGESHGQRRLPGYTVHQVAKSRRLKRLSRNTQVIPSVEGADFFFFGCTESYGGSWTALPHGCGILVLRPGIEVASPAF